MKAFFPLKWRLSWLFYLRKGLAVHIPDGYLGPETYGGLWAATIPFWLIASKHLKEKVKEAQVPFLAMASSFSLLVMLFAIPLPGGTTAHITGMPIVAISLGPWASVLAVSVALSIQAILFGEGGITTLGANCFNMAIVGSFVSYGFYRLLSETNPTISNHGFLIVHQKRHKNLCLPNWLGAGIGAYFAINVSALLGALELGLQPFIHQGPGSTSYFPFPLKVTLPAILIPHLTIVGGLEVIITMIVLTFLQKMDILKKKNLGGMVILTALFSLLFMVGELKAHEFWIEQRGKESVLVFGHGTNREEFDITKIKTLKAFDQEGKLIEIKKEAKKKEVILQPSASPTLMIAVIDNGYWSKTIYGWRNLPKRKASRVVEAIRSLNYAKILLSWGDWVSQPIKEMSLDLVPLKNPFSLRPGEMFTIKATYEGRPLGGIDVVGADHNLLGKTNADGEFNFPLTQDHQRMVIIHKVALKDDPDADSLHLSTTLNVEVKK